MPIQLAKYWKAVAPLLTVLGELVAANLITGTALHYAQVIIAVGGFVGTILSPKNAPA